MAGVAGGLGGEVVGVAMDDDGFSDDLVHPKSAGEHGHFGFSLMGQQRRQVPGVVRVGLAGGVIMAAAIRKAPSPTAAAFVDMKRIKPVPGQALDLRRHQHAAAILAEPDRAHEPGIGPAAADTGNRPGQSAWLHKITSIQYMPPQPKNPLPNKLELA